MNAPPRSASSLSHPPTIELYQGDLPPGRFTGSTIAIDTETMGLDPYRDRLCLVQLSEGDGSAVLVQLSGSYDAPELKRLLADDSVLKLFHFGRFDMAVLKHYFGVMPRPVYCTKVASKLARTFTDRHGLKDLCRELLGIELSKQQQSSDWGAPELTQEQLNYAASDVLHLHALREKLDIMLRREGREGLARACLEFLPTRVELDLRGWSEIDPFAH
ncbi:MAG: ribonuclease D [Methyloceanibacter sp.]